MLDYTQIISELLKISAVNEVSFKQYRFSTGKNRAIGIRVYFDGHDGNMLKVEQVVTQMDIEHDRLKQPEFCARVVELFRSEIHRHLGG